MLQIISRKPLAYPTWYSATVLAPRGQHCNATNRKQQAGGLYGWHSSVGSAIRLTDATGETKPVVASSCTSSTVIVCAWYEYIRKIVKVLA